MLQLLFSGGKAIFPLIQLKQQQSQLPRPPLPVGGDEECLHCCRQASFACPSMVALIWQRQTLPKLVQTPRLSSLLCAQENTNIFCVFCASQSAFKVTEICKKKGKIPLDTNQLTKALITTHATFFAIFKLTSKNCSRFSPPVYESIFRHDFSVMKSFF